MILEILAIVSLAWLACLIAHYLEMHMKVEIMLVLRTGQNT
jgi:hypothetical protein